MKKFIALCTVLFSVSSFASLITVQVDNTDVAVSDTIQVSLLATDFTSFDTFDFDLNFDTSLFTYDASSLESDLLVNSPFMFEINQIDGQGMAFSYLDFSSFAGGDFMLAKFNLTASAAGTSFFSLADAIFSEFNLDQMDNVTFDVDLGQSVSASAVPEPSSMALFGLAGLALVGFRRKA